MPTAAQDEITTVLPCRVAKVAEDLRVKRWAVTATAKWVMSRMSCHIHVNHAHSQTVNQLFLWAMFNSHMLVYQRVPPHFWTSPCFIIPGEAGMFEEPQLASLDLPHSSPTSGNCPFSSFWQRLELHLPKYSWNIPSCPLVN